MWLFTVVPAKNAASILAASMPPIGAAVEPQRRAPR